MCLVVSVVKLHILAISQSVDDAWTGVCGKILAVSDFLLSVAPSFEIVNSKLEPEDEENDEKKARQTGKQVRAVNIYIYIYVCVCMWVCVRVWM
jgi:hypothetical protein